jgi:hypothetical protein
MQDLSTPWKTVQLQEVAEVVSGYGFPKKHQGESSGELPFFKVGDISREVQEGKKFIQTAENYVSHSIAEEISAKPVPSGAIVFAKIGEAVKLNRRGVTSQECLIDNNVMALIPKEDGINGDYLYYFMQSFDLGKLCRATTVPSVRKSDVVEIELPLPPLPEQRRIVAKIEELFSNLDAGRADLQTAQRQLERYRLSVLQAAVEGRLTAAWRRTTYGRDMSRPNDVEPADALLERIQAKKKELYEAKKIRKPKKAEPITKEEIPFELPNHWEWARLTAVVQRAVDCLHKTAPFEDHDTGYYCVDTTCMSRSKIEYDELRPVSEATYQEWTRRMIPEPGDVHPGPRLLAGRHPQRHRRPFAGGLQGLSELCGHPRSFRSRRHGRLHRHAQPRTRHHRTHSAGPASPW